MMKVVLPTIDTMTRGKNTGHLHPGINTGMEKGPKKNLGKMLCQKDGIQGKVPEGFAADWPGKRGGLGFKENPIGRRKTKAQ